MSRKRVVKIPNSAAIKCPHCGKKTRVPVFPETNTYFLDCKKCKQKIETPPAHCCLICAFSNKKCPESLLMEARTKNLEVRYPQKQSNQTTKITENKPILLIDEKIINK